MAMMRTQTCNLLMKVEFLVFIHFAGSGELDQEVAYLSLEDPQCRVGEGNYINWRPSYSAASSVFHLDTPSHQNLSQLPWTSQQAWFIHKEFKPSVLWGRVSIPQALCLMKYPHSAPGFLLSANPTSDTGRKVRYCPKSGFSPHLDPQLRAIPTFLLSLTQLQISFLMKHRHIGSAWTKL